MQGGAVGVVEELHGAKRGRIRHGLNVGDLTGDAFDVLGAFRVDRAQKSCPELLRTAARFEDVDVGVERKPFTVVGFGILHGWKLMLVGQR